MAETSKQPKVTDETSKPAEPAPVERTAISRFEDMEREFDRLMEGFLSRSWLRPFRFDRSPFRAPQVEDFFPGWQFHRLHRFGA